MTRGLFLWTEKYRPKTVDECILPEQLKETFKQFVKQGNIPNLLLTGSAGTGKTTIARAMLEELKCDYTIINGSLKGNIDTLRTDIAGYASSVSFKGGRKYIILDEADYLTHHTQPALRNFMEEFSKNCGFILTANYRNKIIEPLQSRCAVIEFQIGRDEAPKLAAQFMKRIQAILDKEGVEYDKAAVVALIKKHFPDWRRVLNELQRYSVTGKIDSGIMTNMRADSIKELIGFLKKKDFTNVRKWTGENLNNDQEAFFREFYDEASSLFQPSYVPELVLILAKYMYQASFVLDPEINFVAAMVEIMMTAQWNS